MPKRSSLEQSLDRLSALRAAPSSAEFRQELVRALGSKTSYLAAKAAEMVSEYRVADLGPELVAAFGRFLADPASDRGCEALTAVAKALLDTGAGEAAVPTWLAGVKHRQPDGPGGADAAGALRGYCGLGLLTARYPDALVTLVDLLADPEPAARVAAARGLADTGREEIALVLRLKLNSGPDDPEVLSECMAGLLRLDPARSLPLVAGFLHGEDDETRDVAALALGESRRPEALQLLQAHWQRRRRDDPTGAATALLAASLLRQPQAIEWLVSLLPAAEAPAAQAAVEALAIHRRDAALKERVHSALAGREEPGVRRAFEKAFGE